MKKIAYESLSKREEKDHFAEFMEDFNTCTLPAERYYDLAADEQRKREQALKNPQHAAIQVAASDEERMRLARLAERESQARQAETERLNQMKAALQAAKATGESSQQWRAIQQRHESDLSKPTFESIAKQRKEAEKLRELEFKKKYK